MPTLLSTSLLTGMAMCSHPDVILLAVITCHSCGDLKVYENAALYATVTYEVENAGSQFGYSGGVRFLF